MKTTCLISFLSFCSFFTSCKKDSADSPTTSSAIIISRISPSGGSYGTQVTINGKNLQLSDSVFVNGVTATIEGTPSDTLVVIDIPKAAGTGPVTIASGGTLISGPSFNFIYTSYVITVAGTGSQGAVIGSGNALTSSLDEPIDVTVDTAGNLFIVDCGSSPFIKKVTPQGMMSTLSGNGQVGDVNGAGNIAEFI